MSLTLYRVELDPAHDRFALVRIGVAAPSDLWKSEFDLVPGPAAFAWGGSTASGTLCRVTSTKTTEFWS